MPRGNEWCKRLESDEGAGAEDDDEEEVVVAAAAEEEEEEAEVGRGAAGRDIGGEWERKGRGDEYKRCE